MSIRVRVRVTPGSRKETFVKAGVHAYVSTVREVAQGGVATARVRVLVARFYAVPLASVSLKTGAQSRSKTFLVVQ